MPVIPSPFTSQLQLLATTGVAGFTLVNATPSIFSFTFPNDGKLHRYQVFVQQIVTSLMTGGETAIVFRSLDGTLQTQQFGAAGLAAGLFGPAAFAWTSGLVQAGSTLTIEQFTAMSAGASTLWCELWGS